ncbi:MAG: hypothetical protein QM765_45860 [Myxococcales bacterium]
MPFASFVRRSAIAAALALAIAAALAFAACAPRFDLPDGSRLSCHDQQCPPDWTCRNEIRRPPGSPGPYCGDGIVDPDLNETCDCSDGTGPLPDGCAGPNSDTAPNRCRSLCRLASCGDGTLDSAEECDDGDTDSGDGCSKECRKEFCGNARKDEGEVCDDGNNVAGDCCAPNCQSVETCGNGVVDFATGEQCDDGRRCSDGNACFCADDLLAPSCLDAPQCAGLPDPTCAPAKGDGWRADLPGRDLWQPRRGPRRGLRRRQPQERRRLLGRLPVEGDLRQPLPGLRQGRAVR